MRLENKVVVVTASTRGIGKAIVDKCALEGAIVYMAARNEKKANEAILAMGDNGRNVKFVYYDASDMSSLKKMLVSVFEKERRIDVLVNNFGTSDPRLDRQISDTDPDYFINTVGTNLSSVFIASQNAVNIMRKQENGGSIINISSIAADVPDVSQIAYGTSKAAINYMTKLIAVQEARNNIRCNAIMPGMTATDAVKEKISEEFRNTFLRQTPMKRMANPEDIANAVVYFASDESSYVTGQVLAVSGGFGLATPVYGDFINNSRV